MSEELDYYQSIQDYDQIAKFLELDGDDFIPNVDLLQFVPNYETCIIVDNIPVTTPDKIPKLLSALYKMFNQFCPTLDVADIDLPMEPSGATNSGFCFVKFNYREEAEKAVIATNGFAMGRNILKVTFYTDLDKYEAVPDAFVPPMIAEFKPRPDPSDHLCDPLGRDQFAVRHDKETEVYWANTTVEEPTPVYCGEREKASGKTWCENRIAWSSQGSYLATFHPPGIRLSGFDGQEQFQFQGRLPHEEVERIDFSPCENYAATYRLSPKNPHADPQKAIAFWNVQTGENIRNFQMKNPLEPKFQVKATVLDTKGKGKDKDTKVEKVIRGRVVSYTPYGNGDGVFTIEEGNEVYDNVQFNKVEPLQEPNNFKWSPDGQYVARVGPDIIQVFTLPDMQLLDKKSLAAKDVVDFAWSPTKNVISYWSPAVGNYPATINIVSIPSREGLCSRKFFDVAECSMIWQDQGDYLCVKMQNKKRVNILVFFRLNDPGVPVEQLEFTETIQQVSFEPFGDRFVVVLGERNPTISFYSLGAPAPTGNKKQEKKEINLLFNVTGIQCNKTLWSPAGGVIALAHFGVDSCNFQLHDVDSNLKLAFKSHSRCNNLYWDPSGRLLASCTITELRNMGARGHPEDGYNLYSFQGNLLQQVKMDKLYFFLWRPRPKHLLTPELKKVVAKTLKKYEKQFERIDRQRLEELNKELLTQRRGLASDFMAVIKRNRERVAQLRAARIAARDGFDAEDASNYKEEIQFIETVLETRTK